MNRLKIITLLVATVLSACGGDSGGNGVTNPGDGGGSGPVARVELTETNLTLIPGTSIQVQARVYDATNHQFTNPTIVWTSNANGVATVNTNGLISGVTAGTALIKATSGGKEASVNVVVQNPQPIVTSLDPITVGVNTANTIRILGTGFMTSTQARLNGANRPTTFISPTEVRMAIVASDVPTATTYQVSVINPTPGGGPSNVVIFNATQAPPPSSFVCPATPYFFPNVMSGDLGGNDCRLSDNTFFDFYSFTIAAQQQVTFSMASNTMDSYLLAVNNKDEIIAVNDDATSSTFNSTLRVVLPAGTYRIAANSLGANQAGSYSFSGLTTAATSAQLCNELWVVKGVEINDNVSGNDCRNGNFNSDEFTIALTAGQKVTLTMTSTAFTPVLRMFNGSTQVATSNAAGSTATITFTAPSSETYLIDAGTAAAGAVGAYTLVVQ